MDASSVGDIFSSAGCPIYGFDNIRRNPFAEVNIAAASGVTRPRRGQGHTVWTRRGEGREGGRQEGRAFRRKSWRLDNIKRSDDVNIKRAPLAIDLIPEGELRWDTEFQWLNLVGHFDDSRVERPKVTPLHITPRCVSISNMTIFTRSIVYKGWLTRDDIWRLVGFEKKLRDATTSTNEVKGWCFTFKWDSSH